MSEPPDPKARRIPGNGSHAPHAGTSQKDAQEDAQENVQKDAKKDAQKDAQEDAQENVQKDAKKTEARKVDHALLRRAQTGEEQAFAELVKRYERRAWRVARNMVPSDEDAQDLAQEAFLRVFRNLDRFDFEHDFTTWLYRIVTNLCIDHLRKRRPAISTSALEGEDERDLDLPDHRQELPSDQIELRETALKVHACLEALAPHFHSVLVLREFEGLPCTEIAEIVGATHVTVRWRLHRGRKLFQEEWERRERLAEARLGEDAWLESDPEGEPRIETAD